ncbi:MAG TPA: serine/threonine-protein kinase [Kofleriaceae bacterium]|nr:serine/threonine-protein kinase [Kofleriaceae bacterium]
MYATERDPLLGEEVAGYRIVALIGRGGMGQVYRAVQRSIGAQVAIKVLSHDMARDPEIAERFVAEARVPNLVRHDGLVNILGLGVLGDGRPYQLMEFLDGVSLATLYEHAPLPLGTLCRLAREALRALAALHAGGIVHRDVKPSNLFVTTGGRLKLLDFGIAKLVQPDGRNLTRTGQALGTPEYMSPEQAEGAAVDRRTDLYALGIVLYEGATGARPFEGHLLEALARHDRPPHVEPAALDAVIQTAMAPDAAARYGSADAMEAALAAVCELLPEDAFGALPVIARAAPAAPTAAPTVAPASDATLPARLGRYAIERTLARGASGRVLVGLDATVGRRVALKLLDVGGERRARLVAEARALARVSHPNVVALYELGEDGDTTFLALELVEGGDLARWLETPRPHRAIIEMFVAAGRGLAAVHEVGVVHRDFKPENVLVGRDGRPRVSDFGLAGAAHGGTPAYMAPEQVEGGELDARADQFAFAVALWQALHGELPYPGESATALALAARRGELRAPRAPDVPAAVNAALRRALAGDPAARFATMRELLAALERRPARRWRWPAALAALAALAAVAGAEAFALRRGERPRPPSLEAIRALPDPGAILRALGTLDDAALASEDARELGLEAAAAGPSTRIDEGARITAVALDGDRVATASAAGIAIRDLRGALVQRLPPPADTVRALRLAGDHVLALVRDGVLDVPLAGGATSYAARCQQLGDNEAPAEASADLEKLACPEVGWIQVVSGSGPVLLSVPPDQWQGFSDDSRRAITLHDGELALRDLATGAVVATRPVGELRAVAVRGDLCAYADRSHVVVWNVASGQSHAEDLVGVEHLAITGSVVAASSARQVLVIGADGKRAAMWPTDEDIRALALFSSPRLGLRALIELPSALVVKDLARDRELAFGGAVSVVAHADDPGLIAVASAGELALWHTDLVPPVTHLLPAPYQLAVAPGGGTLAYSGDDALVVVDVPTWTERTYPAPQPLIGLRFSPDGQTLVAIDATGMVCAWPIRPDGPGRQLGTVDPHRVHEIRVADDGSVRIADYRGPVEEIGGRRPCGDAPQLAFGARYAYVIRTPGLDLCELATGRVVHHFDLPDPRLISGDDRGMVVVDRGRARRFSVPDGRELALAPADVTHAWLDHDRVFAMFADRTCGLLPVGAAPIRLAGSGGVTGLVTYDDLALAVTNHELAMWHVDRPGVRRVIGRIANVSVLRVYYARSSSAVISNGLVLPSADAPAPRFALTVWPTEARDVAELRRWIEAAR